MKLTVFITAWLLFLGTAGWSQPVINLDDERQVFSIGSSLYLLEDKQGGLSFQQVQSGRYDRAFVPGTQDVPNFGNSTSAVWCKFKIKNKTQQRQWYLEVASPWMDSVALYEEMDDGSFQSRYTGQDFPYEKRELYTNQLLFRIELPEQSTRLFYLRLRSDKVMNFPISLATLETRLEQNHDTDFFQGIYYGFIVLVMLYNLFIYMSLRDKSYLYYVLYTFCMGGVVYCIRGYIYEIYGSYLGDIDLIPILSGLTSIFALLFTNSFLHVKNYAPRLQKLLYMFIAIDIVGILFCIAGNSFLSLLIIQFAILPTTIAIMIAGVVTLRNGYSPAKFFLIAWTLYLVSVGITVLKDLGLISFNAFTNNILQIGSCLEITLLSFALADKINFYKEEKENAQAAIVSFLKENERMISEQKELLEIKVRERTRELEEANEEIKLTNEELKTNNEELNSMNEQLNDTLVHLESQKKIIETKNTHITDSIHYARRIQTAILPPEEKIRQLLPELFILYKPKDIVCGDFYWYSMQKQSDTMLIAASDCTGHGVPAALMTVLGTAILHQIIMENKILQPSLILQELDKRLLETLQQRADRHAINDGMDIALCLIDRKNHQIIFSGAKRPLYLFSEGKFREIKGSRFPIGSWQFEEKVFEEHIIDYRNGDVFYLFTDGYTDQFGGKQGKKLMSRNFKDLLERIQSYNMEDQKGILDASIEAWRGDFQQTDDILVIGVKL